MEITLFEVADDEHIWKMLRGARIAEAKEAPKKFSSAPSLRSGAPARARMLSAFVSRRTAGSDGVIRAHVVDVLLRQALCHPGHDRIPARSRFVIAQRLWRGNPDIGRRASDSRQWC